MPIYKMDGRKDGKQKYRVRINYQDNTGRGRQIDRVTYGLDEAKLLEKSLLNDIGNEQQGRSMTIESLYKEYICSKKLEARESSIEKIQNILDLHVIPQLGKVKLHKLSVSDLQKWKLSLSEKGYKIKTNQNIYGTLKTMLNYALRMEYISRNPLNQVKSFSKSDEIEIKSDTLNYYTADEFKKFIAIAKQEALSAEKKHNLYEWNYYVFFCVAFYTGLRKGEIYGLQWTDIKGNFITVKRSVSQKVPGADRITPPKSKNSIRTIQLPAPLLTIIKEHKKRNKKIPGFTNSSFICGIDKPLRDSNTARRNKDYAKKANLKHIRLHDFRHSHASLLANNGINIQEIARRLGHSQVELTWNTYAHLYPAEEEKAVKILNKIT